MNYDGLDTPDRRTIICGLAIIASPVIIGLAILFYALRIFT